MQLLIVSCTAPWLSALRNERREATYRSFHTFPIKVDGTLFLARLVHLDLDLFSRIFVFQPHVDIDRRGEGEERRHDFHGGVGSLAVVVLMRCVLVEKSAGVIGCVMVSSRKMRFGRVVL